MTHVLVLITIFSSSAGLHSQTGFQEFETRAACEQAARSVRDAISGMKGVVGRDVVAQCHAKR